MSLVLDASMSIAWMFEDECTPAARRVMLRVEEGGATVPSLWRLEVANVLRTAVRRGRCDEDFVDRALIDLGGLAIALDRETDARAWSDIRRLSREEGLTLYDAAYLELAIRLDRPLASADGALLDAARRRGLEVLTA
ncbi:MAG: type II toxin-antitoxin system VapC family toxin [Caulobacteraceae bacterium]